jgi:hypothetical protein
LHDEFRKGLNPSYDLRSFAAPPGDDPASPSFTSARDPLKIAIVILAALWETLGEHRSEYFGRTRCRFFLAFIAAKIR